MSLKAGLLLITLLAGSYAQKRDMSTYFDHSNPQARIVGGSTAGSVPHMVGLCRGRIIRNLFCGASLITNRHILTAAHCIEPIFVNGSLVRSARAVVGTNRWRTGGAVYRFSRNFTHPKYDANALTNDIGVLITSADVVLSSKVKPVVLHTKFVGAGVKTIVNGWGLTSTGGALSENLLELFAIVIDGMRCVTDVRDHAKELNEEAPDVEPDIQICTLNSTGHGACNGDSGSALIRADNKEQVGVVSWGFPCAQGAPDIFTRVSAFDEWIQQAIKIFQD